MFAAFTGRSLGFYHAGDVGPGVIASILGTMALLGIYQRFPRDRVLEQSHFPGGPGGSVRP